MRISRAHLLLRICHERTLATDGVPYDCRLFTKAYCICLQRRVFTLLCNVATVSAAIPGGIDFYAHSRSYIPNREVLDFAYFKEKGNKLVKEEKLTAAIRCYDACHELCPENVTIHNNKALCALKMNRSDEVLANCEKVLESEPNNIKALYRQAMAWKALKEFDNAVQNLEKVLSIEENSDARRKLEQIKKRHKNKNC